MADLDDRAAAQHAPAVDGVTLASLHAAKGLEWDAVFLVGLSEGLMPISLAEGAAAVEEERRLLYVGITRAREHLHLSWARSRSGGRATRRADPVPGRGAARVRPGPRPAAPPRTPTPSWSPRCAPGASRSRSRPAGRRSTCWARRACAAVAQRRPTTLAELARVGGIGQDTVLRHGQALLAIVAGRRPNG